jgi:hypothetical protein
MDMEQAKNLVEIDPLDIRGQKVPTFVRRSGDGFCASLGGKDFYAESVEALRLKLMAATKRVSVKIDVPFTQVTDSGVRHGTVTSVHASTGNFMVLWTHAPRPEQESPYLARTYRPFEPEEAAEATRLIDAVKAAEAAKRKFLGRILEIRLEDEVKKAIDAAPEPAGKEVKL